VISTYLVEHPWLTTVALVAVLAVGPIAGFWLIDRPHFASHLGVASLLRIAALTLMPASRSLAVGCATEWDFPTLDAVELVANVVLFISPCSADRAKQTTGWRTLSNAALGAAIAAVVIWFRGAQGAAAAV
jgi:hypothetical protein